MVKLLKSLWLVGALLVVAEGEVNRPLKRGRFGPVRAAVECSTGPEC